MKSFQTLIVFLLPVELLAAALSFCTRHLYFNLGRRESLANLLRILPSETSSYLEYVGAFCGFAACMVIAIWLYFQAKREAGNAWIWACFGFLAGYWAIAFWFLARLPELLNGARNEAPNA